MTPTDGMKMEWISVKEGRIPKDFQDIYVKTDCKDCPILSAIYVKGEFILPVLIQCDKHYLEEPKFKFIGHADDLSILAYTSRITYWIPRSEVTKE